MVPDYMLVPVVAGVWVVRAVVETAASEQQGRKALEAQVDVVVGGG